MRRGTQTIERNPIKLLPGFGVAIVEQYMSDGERRGRSSQGRDVAVRDLVPAKPSRLAGVEIEGSGLDFGWGPGRSSTWPPCTDQTSDYYTDGQRATASRPRGSEFPDRLWLRAARV